MKYNSIIKYGGNWINDMITLTQQLNQNDNVIKCNINTTHQRYNFEIGDLITLKIRGMYYTCKLTSLTEIEIISKKGEPSIMEIQDKVYVLLHLTSKDAEDLVTKYELNRLRNQFGAEWSEKLFTVNQEINTSSYDLAEFVNNDVNGGILRVDFYDIIKTQNSDNISFEKSDVDWTIDSTTNMFTWNTLTPIKNSVLVIVISFKKN